jgi:hypothetical protein
VDEWGMIFLPDYQLIEQREAAQGIVKDGWGNYL